MRRHKARLIYKGKGKTPCTVEIDDFVIVKRGEEGVVCQDEEREHALGTFDFSMSSGEGNTKIFWENDRLFIQDLGSYNGTFMLYEGDTEPIRGWSKRKKGEPRAKSEKVPIKKTGNIKVARTLFTVEIEPMQTIIEHTGSGDVNITQVAGDYQDIDIRDSVINRSNIGTVEKGIDEEVFRKTMDEMDDRNRERVEAIMESQLELKGMTKEMGEKIELRFNEMMKELPFPSGIEKKRMTIILEYECSSCGTHIGTVQDKRWKKWLMLGVAGAMVGVGIATFGVANIGKIPGGDAGIKSIKKIFQEFTGKPMDEIPAEKFLLTNEERDKMLSELRDREIMTKLNFCPSCKTWVCGECFDGDEGMCVRDAQTKGW